MFFFAQWDDPISLLTEVLIAVAVFAVIMFVVLRTNKRERPTLPRDAVNPPDVMPGGPPAPLSAPTRKEK